MKVILPHQPRLVSVSRSAASVCANTQHDSSLMFVSNDERISHCNSSFLALGLLLRGLESSHLPRFIRFQLPGDRLHLTK